MFKKSALIKIEDRDTFLWNKSKFENIKNINIDLKNRNLYLVVEGERVYIKLLSIPKVSKEKLYKIIEYQLKYYFTDMEEILFDYYVCKKLKKSYDVLVFCINSRKLNRLQGLIKEKNKLKLVNLIQFVILDHVKNYINDAQYTLIFMNKDNLYIMVIKNQILIENSIIKDFNGDSEEFFLEFNPIVENQCLDHEKCSIYTLWFPYKDILEELDKNYRLTLLNYSEEIIMESFIKDGKCKICIK
ncbi:hypothetical protein [Haloimpatiens massiliensis]|uniref:hypothetical protein n=1 Tax=Haloimpatiens massiliensis TaxID=1658110 RepID=UPI000C83CF26|nr:hypothetical protein [Haloimpatiens massiliensis]